MLTKNTGLESGATPLHTLWQVFLSVRHVSGASTGILTMVGSLSILLIARSRRRR